MVTTQVSNPVPSQTSQPGPRLLRAITLQRLLSFGPETETLELRGLNVFIGPNGSGKSNLLEAVALLRAAPRLARRHPPGRRGG